MTSEIDASTMRLLINLLIECLQEIPHDYSKPRGNIRYIISELTRASVGPVLVEREAA
jgi:hypothetical protein